MPQEFSVSLDRIIKEHELEVLYCPQNPANILIYSCDVNRPGLQLGGFYEYFDNTRIQIIGKSECAFMEKLSDDERKKAFENEFVLYNDNINMLSGLLTGQVKKNIFYSEVRGYKNSSESKPVYRHIVIRFLIFIYMMV